jgi:dTDP-4-amino-4,6-dideoxygalactose transaminase
MTAAARHDTLLGVPFVDLGLTHGQVKARLLAEIGDLIAAGTFTNGPQVAEFERAYASFCNARHCVGVSSGLDALRLALQAAGIEPQDEVILPADTFIATAEAVTQAGGVPVLVDVSEADYNLDPDAVAERVGPATRFLLPVHLYGQLSDMTGLVAVAKGHDLLVVEDACQAHGAERDGVVPGTVSTAAAFSFYPGKNLGALGDAGAVVTNSPDLAERIRALREHGQTSKYRHDWVGWTARLDTIQAIALLVKLPHLSRWNEERRAAAAYYLDRLADVGDVRLPPVVPGSSPSWHLFVVRTRDPEELARFLGARGVVTGRHYPQPIHLSGAYRSLGHRAGEFPVTEQLARECLSLPIFPGITEQQLAAVCDGVEAYFGRG